jgi:GalNAc5-diNAcBac-PP-undecaprenol beta-1,3-glucosyltransferase
MNPPFFSVVIPTYNRAGFIAKTLQSVLSQTLTDFEVLVVDDGSKDNTAEVVRPFLSSQVYYLPKENAERAAARNYGLARAKGEYVIFLDSDDLFHPSHLATLHAAITAAQPRPDFIATKYDFEREGQHRPSDACALPAGHYGLDLFVKGNVLACNFAVRRQNPGLYLFEEDRRYAAVEDWLFLLQNTQHNTVQLVDALTLTMNDHDNRSMRADNQGLIRRLELSADWMQHNLPDLTAAQRRLLLSHVYYLCSLHAYIDGHRSQALRFARLAWSGLGNGQRAMLALRLLLGPRLVGLLKRNG